jgi:hypothetical protein
VVSLEHESCEFWWWYMWGHVGGMRVMHMDRTERGKEEDESKRCDRVRFCSFRHPIVLTFGGKQQDF